MTPCARLEPFVDGELAAEAIAEFRDHLADCARCQAVLGGRMQEAMVTGELADGAAPPVAVAAPPVRAPRSRRAIRYLAPVAAVAMAAAAVLWLVARRGAEPAPPIALALASEHRGAVLRGDTAHVGDLLRPVVRGDGHRALWVYLGDRELVVACPGAAGCTSTAHDLALELRLSAPGSYTVIAIASPAPVAPPAGSLDVMLSTVTSTGAHIEISHVDVN